MLQDMERPFTLLPAVYHANNNVGNKIVGRNMLRPASSSVVTGKSYCRVSPSDEMDHRLAIGEPVRWAQRRCFVRSLRTTCAGYAATATGVRSGRTGNLRSSCRRVRLTGAAHGDYSIRIAGGRCCFCCRAAWSLLRGRQTRADDSLHARGLR